MPRLVDADERNVDFQRWEHELARIGYCANPIHLRGAIEHVDKTTGEVRQVYSTDDTGQTLRVRCGSRLASKCPSCAWLYQQDAYHLLKAGLSGGKGLPSSVATHPRVFVTLTAPSFGAIHMRAVDAGGRVRPCHPRDHHAAVCPHGRRLDCRLRHRDDDPRLAEPLCVACYRYEDATLWNFLAPELWRRTVEYTYRKLAERLDVGATKARKLVHLEYAKVAEWQTRGQIHFHAIIRLDAATEDGAVRSPDGLTVEDLRAAVDAAIRSVPPPEAGLGWGEQNLIRDITSDGTAGEVLTEDRVAGYLAKYATKATEAIVPGTFGDLFFDSDTRMHDVMLEKNVRAHVARLVKTALTLGDMLGSKRLLRYAKTFGYGGHFLTKSRRYSTTFARLRRTRVEYRRPAYDAWDRPIDPEQVEVVSTFAYVTSGHRTAQERELAIAAAARARERRRQRWAKGAAA